MNTNIQNRVLALSTKIDAIGEDYFGKLIEEIDMTALDYCSYNSSYFANGKWIKCQYDDLFNVYVLDSYKGWQVLRVFQFRFHLSSCMSWMKYRMKEVAQRWINSNGECVNLCCSFWNKSFGQFNMKSKLKVVKDLPFFNNENNWFYDFYQLSIKKLANMDYRWIMKSVDGIDSPVARFMSSNVAEFLFKCGYKKLFNNLLTCSSNYIEGVVKYFDSIKVAHRHHFNFGRKIGMWLDTLRMMETIGADIRNPKFICATAVKRTHDEFLKKYNKFKAKVEKLRKEKQFLMDQARYHEAHKMYFGIVFSDDVNNLHFHVIQNASEMVEEGKQMHHCVGMYVTKDNSLILSCTDDKGNRISTIEVELTNFTIVQNQGLSNSKPKMYAEINNAINSNMNMIKMAKMNYEKELSLVA